MGKSQFDVCWKVLKKLHQEGALNDLILIGSWCAYFYKYYFTKRKFLYDTKENLKYISFELQN